MPDKENYQQLIAQQLAKHSRKFDPAKIAILLGHLQEINAVNEKTYAAVSVSIELLKKFSRQQNKIKTKLAEGLQGFSKKYLRYDRYQNVVIKRKAKLQSHVSDEDLPLIADLQACLTGPEFSYQQLEMVFTKHQSALERFQSKPAKSKVAVMLQPFQNEFIPKLADYKNRLLKQNSKDNTAIVTILMLFDAAFVKMLEHDDLKVIFMRLGHAEISESARSLVKAALPAIEPDYPGISEFGQLLQNVEKDQAAGDVPPLPPRRSYKDDLVQPDGYELEEYDMLAGLHLIRQGYRDYCEQNNLFAEDVVGLAQLFKANMVDFKFVPFVDSDSEFEFNNFAVIKKKVDQDGDGVYLGVYRINRDHYMAYCLYLHLDQKGQRQLDILTFDSLNSEHRIKKSEQLFKEVFPDCRIGAAQVLMQKNRSDCGIVILQILQDIVAGFSGENENPVLFVEDEEMQFAPAALTISEARYPQHNDFVQRLIELRQDWEARLAAVENPMIYDINDQAVPLEAYDFKKNKRQQLRAEQEKYLQVKMEFQFKNSKELHGQLSDSLCATPDLEADIVAKGYRQALQYFFFTEADACDYLYLCLGIGVDDDLPDFDSEEYAASRDEFLAGDKAELINQLVAHPGFVELRETFNETINLGHEKALYLAAAIRFAKVFGQAFNGYWARHQQIPPQLAKFAEEHLCSFPVFEPLFQDKGRKAGLLAVLRKYMEEHVEDVVEVEAEVVPSSAEILQRLTGLDQVLPRVTALGQALDQILVSLNTYPAKSSSFLSLKRHRHTSQGKVIELKRSCRRWQEELGKLAKQDLSQLDLLEVKVIKVLYEAMLSSRTWRGGISTDARSISNLLRGPLCQLLEVSPADIEQTAVADVEAADEKELQKQRLLAAETLIFDKISEKTLTFKAVAKLYTHYCDGLNMPSPVLGNIEQYLLQQLGLKRLFADDVDKAYFKQCLAEHWQATKGTARAIYKNHKTAENTFLIALAEKLESTDRSARQVLMPGLGNEETFGRDTLDSLPWANLFISKSGHFFDVDDVVRDIEASNCFVNTYTNEVFSDDELRELKTYPQVAKVMVALEEKLRLQGDALRDDIIGAIKDLANGLLHKDERGAYDRSGDLGNKRDRDGFLIADLSKMKLLPEAQKDCEEFYEHYKHLDEKERKALDAYVIDSSGINILGAKTRRSFADLFHAIRNQEECFHASAFWLCCMVNDFDPAWRSIDNAANNAMAKRFKRAQNPVLKF